MEESFENQFAQIEEQKNSAQQTCKTKYDEQSIKLQSDFAQKTGQIESEHDSVWRRLKECWLVGLNTIKAMLDETQKLDSSLFYDWQNPAWPRWIPGKNHQPLIRFGTIGMYLNLVAEPVAQLMEPSFKNRQAVFACRIGISQPLFHVHTNSSQN